MVLSNFLILELEGYRAQVGGQRLASFYLPPPQTPAQQCLVGQPVRPGNLPPLLTLHPTPVSGQVWTLRGQEKSAQCTQTGAANQPTDDDVYAVPCAQAAPGSTHHGKGGYGASEGGPSMLTPAALEKNLKGGPGSNICAPVQIWALDSPRQSSLGV